MAEMEENTSTWNRSAGRNRTDDTAVVEEEEDEADEEAPPLLVPIIIAFMAFYILVYSMMNADRLADSTIADCFL